MPLADTVRLATILLEESSLANRLGHPSGVGGIPALYTPAQFIDATAAAAKLESLQGRLRAIAERQCNGYSYGYHGAPFYSKESAEEAELRDDRNEEKLRASALALLEPYGAQVHFNRDPRGSAIKLQTPKSGRYNTMGGAETGWAV